MIYPLIILRQVDPAGLTDFTDQNDSAIGGQETRRRLPQPLHRPSQPVFESICKRGREPVMLRARQCLNEWIDVQQVDFAVLVHVSLRLECSSRN